MTRRNVLRLGTIAALLFATGAQAQDLFPRYQPREQTPSERLENFRTPPPAPQRETPLDGLVKTYENAPVRPAFDPVAKQPVIQYNKRF